MPLFTKHQLAKLIDRETAAMGLGISFAPLQRIAYPYCTATYQRSAIDSDPFHAGSARVPYWYESRTDPSALFKDDRSYIVLRCVCDTELNAVQAFAYEIALTAWRKLCDQASLQAAA